MGIRSFKLGCTLAVLLASATAWGQTAEQTQMAQRVATALKESGQMSGYRVGVKYQDGVAWLLGTVTSQAQAETACALAEQVEGIDRVICKLEVVGGPSETPATPAAPVRESEPSLLYGSLQDSVQQIESTPDDSRVTPAGAATPRVIRRPVAQNARPLPVSQQQAHAIRMASAQQGVTQAGCYGAGMGAGPMPQGYVPGGSGPAVSYDNASMPGYAWPSYAAYPNYAAVSYPTQYSPTAWPYIGPFYPYPQVPLGWRKVTLEWDDGWWMLDFSHKDCQ